MEKDKLFDNETIREYRIELLNRIIKVLEINIDNDDLLFSALRSTFYNYIDYLEKTILKDSTDRIDTYPYISNINKQFANYFSKDVNKSLISIILNIMIDTNSMIIEMMSLVIDLDQKLYFYGKSYRELRESGLKNEEITEEMMKVSPYDSEVMLYLNHNVDGHSKFIADSLLTDIYLLGVINDYIWEKDFDLLQTFSQFEEILGETEISFFRVIYKRLKKYEEL